MSSEQHRPTGLFGGPLSTRLECEDKKARAALHARAAAAQEKEQRKLLSSSVPKVAGGKRPLPPQGPPKPSSMQEHKRKRLKQDLDSFDDLNDSSPGRSSPREKKKRPESHRATSAWGAIEHGAAQAGTGHGRAHLSGSGSRPSGSGSVPARTISTGGGTLKKAVAGVSSQHPPQGLRLPAAPPGQAQRPGGLPQGVAAATKGAPLRQPDGGHSHSTQRSPPQRPSVSSAAAAAAATRAPIGGRPAGHGVGGGASALMTKPSSSPILAGMRVPPSGSATGSALAGGKASALGQPQGRAGGSMAAGQQQPSPTSKAPLASVHHRPSAGSAAAGSNNNNSNNSQRPLQPFNKGAGGGGLVAGGIRKGPPARPVLMAQRGGFYPAPPQRRPGTYRDDDEAADSSEEEDDGFIVDDDEGEEDWRREMREVTRYDPSKFRDEGDDRSMEVGWKEMVAEEKRSARLGRAEDDKEEVLERRRKEQKSAKRSKGGKRSGPAFVAG